MVTETSQRRPGQTLKAEESTDAHVLELDGIPPAVITVCRTRALAGGIDASQYDAVTSTLPNARRPARRLRQLRDESAGLRAVEMVKPVLTALKMVPVPDAVSGPLRLCLDEHGVLRPRPGDARGGAGLLSELRILAEALAPVRATVRAEEDLAMLAP